ncbi:hypothetical protein B0H14DRAFT_2643085 [Mycena olivaceomarginata]|nr:hypothetical protein B0H14DRAFT_2643085 [Mycena olivaceomarginata]
MRGVGNLMCVPAVGVGSLIVVPVVLELTRRIFDPHNGYAHFGWIAARAAANSNNYSSPAPAATRASPTDTSSVSSPTRASPAAQNAPEPPRVLAAPGPRISLRYVDKFDVLSAFCRRSNVLGWWSKDQRGQCESGPFSIVDTNEWAGPITVSLGYFIERNGFKTSSLQLIRSQIRTSERRLNPPSAKPLRIRESSSNSCSVRLALWGGNTGHGIPRSRPGIKRRLDSKRFTTSSSSLASNGFSQKRSKNYEQLQSWASCHPDHDDYFCTVMIVTMSDGF